MTNFPSVILGFILRNSYNKTFFLDIPRHCNVTQYEIIQFSSVLLRNLMRPNKDVPTTICYLDLTFSFFLKTLQPDPRFFPLWPCLRSVFSGPEIRRLPRHTLPPTHSFSACLHWIRFFFRFLPVTHALMNCNYVSVVAERIRSFLRCRIKCHL